MTSDLILMTLAPLLGLGITAPALADTLGATPAMASGLVDRVMKMADIVALVDAANPVPAVRGPYKKRVTEISN